MTIVEKISLLFMLSSMLVVFVIIFKKFSVLSVLNTENIPGEKEANFKKEIIKKRVDRDLAKLARVFLFFSKNLKRIFKDSLSFFENSLGNLKAAYIKKNNFSPEKKSKLIKDLFKEAELAEKREDEDIAESKLLEIINLDQKNLLAFFLLGQLYYDNKKFTEAIQTLTYVLKLAVKRKQEKSLKDEISIAEIYFSLAKVGRDMERLDYALECIRESLDLEPNNPRFLDLILDLSIIRKDKGLAWTYFNKMSAINPENNKLQVWREEIMSLLD